MSGNGTILSRNEAEEILQLYLGPSRWMAGNFVYLNRNRARPLDLEYVKQSEQIHAEDLQRYLGVKRLSHIDLDTHIGQLAKYAWLKIGSPEGAGFSPIFDGLSKILEKYPAEHARLESISRRIAYLCYLRNEITYMNEKYDYEEMPIIFEFYTNKVETFTILLVDLLIILGQLWCDRPGSKAKPGPRPTQFKDVFECFKPLPYGGFSIFESINIMLELSAAISARHNYVHGIGPSISLSNEGGVIEFEIPVRQRYGKFKEYMKTELYACLEKPPPADRWITRKDSRFPEFEFVLRRARSGRFDYRRSVVRYKGEVPQYIELLDRLLGLLGRGVTLAIIQ
ncbi:MAG: hypothetical protein ACFFEA_12585 [Candidatus Thorarchaeota archaeon]